MNDKLLEVENLSVWSNRKLLLDHVNLSILQGEIVSILGETGSGKTMLAKSISGILPRNLKSEGKIFYRGQNGKVDLNILSSKERNTYRGKEILWIPQNTNSALNPLINMETQLLLPMMKRLKISKQEARSKIKEVFKILDLDPLEKILKAYPYELSGGMKVRTMIAIGLTMKSKLLILDEPTKGLDSARCRRLMELVKETVNYFGVTVILISHDMETIGDYTKYAAVMYKGKMLDCGKTQEILFEHPHTYVQALQRALPACGMEVSEFEC